MESSQISYPLEVSIPFLILLDPNANTNAARCMSPVPSTPVISFLEGHLNESFTTLITRAGTTGIPLLTEHVNRLLNGFQALHSCSHDVDGTTLSQALLMAIPLLTHNVAPQTELRIVAVLQRQTVHVHAAPVPEASPIDPIVVECRGTPRTRPGVKDTSWVVARKPLERMRQENASETVLVGTEDYALYEGLTTNVFVIMTDNVVYTAPDDHVLPGTIRECVLQACKRLGVPVVLQAPPLACWMSFRAAFLTNAFRILTPIHSLLVASAPPSISVPQTISLLEDHDAHLLVNELRDCVNKMLDKSTIGISTNTIRK